MEGCHPPPFGTYCTVLVCFLLLQRFALTILHFWVFSMSMDVQKHPRESQETLPDSFLQNHNLVSSFTCRPCSNLIDSNFYFKLEWLELAAGAPLDSCMLQAIREDCLNHKPFSISASSFFFCHFSWNFFYFLLLLPTSSLARSQ